MLLMKPPLTVALVACVAAACGCTHERLKIDRAQVQAFCRQAEPVISPDLVGVSFPEMDDRTLMSAVNLARNADPQLYGDLAAVILRVHRAQSDDFRTSCVFPMHQDVPRLFAAKFAYMWQFPGDEPLLSWVADWILVNSPELVNSELLREEISKQGELR